MAWTNGLVHPLGFPPPAEWFTPGRRVTTEELQAWLSSTKPPANPLRTEGDSVKQKRRHKYAANSGHRDDLGLYMNSSLEANALRLFLFDGYQLWSDKQNPPPTTGWWVRYEGRTFVFEIRDKTGVLKQIQRYLPDFELWDEGAYRVVETKGFFTPKTKTIINRMRKHFPEVSYQVVTSEELQQMKMEALYRARRNGPMVLEIPGWE